LYYPPGPPPEAASVALPARQVRLAAAFPVAAGAVRELHLRKSSVGFELTLDKMENMSKK